MLRRILEAVPISGTQLRLTFSDDDIIEVDLLKEIQQGGVFAPLSDPDFFKQVAIVDHGRVLSWPGDIEFCADALWLQARGKAAFANSEREGIG